MTSPAGGGNDEPPPPDAPEPHDAPEPPNAHDAHDDPLLHPASDTGWDHERPPPAPAPVPASAPVAEATSRDAIAGTIEVAPSVVTSSAASPATSAPPTSSPRAPATPPPPRDEPLVPAAPVVYDEDELRSAVGLTPRSGSARAAARKRRASTDASDEDDLPRPPRSRKAIVVPAIGIAAGLAIAALVVLGYANSDRYLLTCEAERAVAEQGRAFPPWGTHALTGEQWRPIKITPETRCQPHETDELPALGRLYLTMILDQATALLTAREVTKLDDAEALLEQALLLTRPPEREPEQLAAERNQHHQEIERMLGDVTYGRATAKVHDAAAALADAAKQFDHAAAQHPRHVSDASAWAAYARKLALELRDGPTGAAPSVLPPASVASSVAGSPPGSAPGSPEGPAMEHPNVPVGVALPVEPGKASADEPPPPPVPAAPDAGVPTGGVLL